MDSVSSMFRRFFDDGGLTVPEVSGIIAAGVFVVQFLFPLTLPFVLLGLLRDRDSVATLSSVTWSVVGRFLHSSYWPSILSADSASNTSVPSRILTVVRISLLSTALITVAGIVTPIGLYETILASNSPTPSSFHYIPDPSQFGYGTLPRIDLPWSRLCGFSYPVECPNSFSEINYMDNATGEYYSVQSRNTQVPQYVIDAFQSGVTSGAVNRTVSSLFDIQSRYYTWSLEDRSPEPRDADNGAPVPVSKARQIAHLIMEREVVLVEGLIVDMVNGGIGFRNHSAPPDQSVHGSEWSEDILFVQPESECVNNNLTIDFTIPQYESDAWSQITNVVLTDHGGFVNLNQTYPWIDFSDSQHHPNLRDRAYKAAFINNVLSMAFMNVTNMNNQSDPNDQAFEYLKSEVGKSFPLTYNDSSVGSSMFLDPYSLKSTTLFGEYLDGLDQGIAANNYTAFNGTNVTTASTPPLYPNPSNINRTSFGDAGLLCQGAGGADIAGINTIAAGCGLMYGAPQPKDGNYTIMVPPGSNWSVPMYSCILTTKALIKTVNFRFNGSRDDLSSVTVTGVRDKEYPSENSKPLWGVEKTNKTLADVRPLWGLLSSPDQGNISLSTLRKESLFLPGYVGFLEAAKTGYQNLPGVNFQSQAIDVAFGINTVNSGDDYSGKANLALFRLWQEYSRDPKDAGRILDLVWSDKAANVVLGTRGLHDPVPAGSSDDGRVPVTFYNRRIRYHLRYAIPAIIILALAALAVLGTLLSCLRNPGFSKMNRLLMKTSQGRILMAGWDQNPNAGMQFTQAKDGSVTAREYPADKPSNDREWRQTIGRKKISVRHDGNQLVVLDADGSRPAQPLPPSYGVATS